MRLRDDWVFYVVLLFIFALLILTIVTAVMSSKVCENAGGRYVVVGQREVRYVVSRVSTEYIDMPIYGTRMENVYECVGDR